jgi:hypothetical protein
MHRGPFETVMTYTQMECGGASTPRRASSWHYISSSTVVPMVMRVPWSVPVICIGELKEVS